MRLVIDRHAAEREQHEKNEAMRVLMDPSTSKDDKAAARQRVTITPQGMLEMVARCIRVEP